MDIDQQQTIIPQEMMQQPPPQQPQPHPQQLHPPVNSYYPQDNSADLTGGLPINLDSLRDGPPGSKPFYPYSTLIRYAIKGAPNQKLLLEDIYYAIESRFPYFRTAPPGWKNSVRHNLSLNPCFQKVPRPLTDRGKGSYWTVNDSVDPRTGVHRVRKKKKGSSSKQAQAQQDQSQQQQQQPQQPQPQQPQDHQQVQQPPPPQIQGDVSYGHPGQQPAFSDPNAQYVPPQAIDPSAGGPSRQPAPAYPATYPPPPFDASFPPMMPPAPAPAPPANIRYGPPPPIGLFSPDESLPYDEHGNIDWHAAWRHELNNCERMTEEQEKAGANQEWFRIMFWKLRSAMVAPPTEPNVHGMAGVPPPPHAHGMPQPAGPGEVPQE